MKINWSELEHLNEWKELLDALELQVKDAINQQDEAALDRLGEQLYEYVKRSPARAWLLDQRALGLLDTLLIKRREWVGQNMSIQLEELESKLKHMKEANMEIEKDLKKDLLTELWQISSKMKQSIGLLSDFGEKLKGEERLRELIDNLLKTADELNKLYTNHES